MVLFLDSPYSEQFFKPFESILKELGILAISSASSEQGQYTTYCAPDEKVNDGTHIKTCMADLVSASFF